MQIQEFMVKNPLPTTEAEILASFVLGKDRSFINAFPETELSRKQLGNLKTLVKRRRDGEPLPYLLGYREFYGRNFLVDKNVLIPRPETENLVEAVVNFAKNKSLTVADIGTGSGAIALTLALEQPNLKLVALDIDPKALAVAKKNAIFYKLENEVEIVQSDLLKSLTRPVDVIVANLPYIPTKNYQQLPAHIRVFEPRVALDSGNSKETFYKRLFAEAKTKLKKDGVIFYEIDGDIFRKDYSSLAAAD